MIRPGSSGAGVLVLVSVNCLPCSPHLIQADLSLPLVLLLSVLMTGGGVGGELAGARDFPPGEALSEALPGQINVSPPGGSHGCSALTAVFTTNGSKSSSCLHPSHDSTMNLTCYNRICEKKDFKITAAHFSLCIYEWDLSEHVWTSPSSAALASVCVSCWLAGMSVCQLAAIAGVPGTFSALLERIKGFQLMRQQRQSDPRILTKFVIVLSNHHHHHCYAGSLLNLWKRDTNNP